MISKIKNIALFKTNNYYVLEITKNNNGQTAYKLLEIQFKANELLIVNRLISNTFDEKFKKSILKDYPLLLHIDGSNLINKKVEKKTGYRNDLVFKGNLNDFYFYEFQQGNDIFVSITRQQYANDIIKQIKSCGAFVIHVALGPFVLANLFKFLKHEPIIPTSNVLLQVEDEALVSFKHDLPQKKEYLINGDTFNEWELPLLATFFDYKFPNPTIEFNQEFLQKNRTEYKFKKWFKIAGIFCLSFLLTTLTISHVLMNGYASTLADKKVQYASAQNTIIEINTLRQKKELKEKILLNNGMNNKSFITKYIADIGNSVNSGIILSHINIMPPLEKVKPDKKINYNVNTIILNGEASNDKVFNEWIKTLEQLSWIEKINIDDYIQETINSNRFTIKITI